VAGDVINRVSFNNAPQRINNVTTLTGTTGSTVVFSVSDKLGIDLDAYPINNDAVFWMNYFSEGMTGRQDSFTLPIYQGAKAIVQTHVVGTGGAVYNLEGSLDGVIWSTIATITHGAVSLNSAYTSITDPWAYFSINLTSVGTATKLVVIGAV
jgi:hypothetical protein